MPPTPMARPLSHQQERINTLYDIITQRHHLDRAYRDSVLACLDAGLTPAQIEKFAGVNKETVRRIAVRRTAARHCEA